jgi:Outer membrane protein beta-barrel domain
VAKEGANIDLLFRNGLKDYEVLPPVEVWNNILPVIRKKQRPVLLLRSAALVAVFLSISFLAYRWSREMTNAEQNPMIAVRDQFIPTRENTNNRLKINKQPANRQVTGTSIIENPTDNQPWVEFTGEEHIESPDSEIMNEAQVMATTDNLIVPPSIQVIRGFSYNNEIYNTGNGTLNKFDFEVPKEKMNRWSISAMASPTVYLQPELSSSDISSQIRSGEQTRISYTGGVGFSYKISKKISIQSGLYYASIGNEVDGISSFAGFHQYDYTKGDHNFEVLTSNGRIFTENADIFLRDYSGDRVQTMYTNDVFDPAKANLSYINNSLFQNFSYLEMPVIFRYKLIDKSIDFNLIGGLSYNLLVNNSVHTVIDGNRYNVGKTEGLNPLMVSSSLGMGMEYNLTDKFSLNLEPTFKYYINPFNEFSGMKSHPYSFGVFSGLSYKF